MRRSIKATLLAVLLAAGAVYFVNPYGAPILSPIARLLGHQHYYVPSGSMEPAIPAGSRVQVCFGDLRPFAVGDIVMLRAGEIIQIKRIAALGASTVEIDGSGVSVNGEPVQQWFDGTSVGVGKEGQFRVPDGNAFLLGDRLGQSIDSRSFGPVPVELLLGRVCGEPVPRKSRIPR